MGREGGAGGNARGGVDGEAVQWLITLSRSPVNLLPALENTDESLLPDPLREAAVEILLSPALELLQKASGEPLVVVRIIFGPEPVGEEPEFLFVAPSVFCSLGLRLDFEEEGEAPLFVGISVPDSVRARRLTDFIRELPVREMSLERYTSLSVSLRFEAGRMRLSLAEIESTVPGDIFLPRDYLAARGEIMLRAGDCGGLSALCEVKGRTVVVKSVFAVDSEEGTSMMENEDPMGGHVKNGENIADAGNETGFSPDDLEMTLVFELERRMVTVRELAALAPGYTFALGASPDSPVTLRINGKDVGSGGLVDLNGTLGVRITEWRVNK